MFDKFEWTCHQVDETLPAIDQPSKPLTEQELQAYLNPPANPPVDLGGCFRKGPGSINTNLGTIEFLTSNMHENETYNFTVTVYKGERFASASLLVDVLPGDSPSVSIR